MTRNWLRPRWYVTQWGGDLVMMSPYPPTFVPEDAPVDVCSRCGVECPNGGYALSSGYLCWDCEPIVRPHKPPTWLDRRLLGPISTAHDTAYWRFAERFGRRIYSAA